MNRVTSATLRAGPPAEPAKITSSISLPRPEEGRVSPITQRMASNRFDLPQPLGPITAVMAGSMNSYVGSTKDLKPESLSRVNFKMMRLVKAGSLFLGERGVECLLQCFVRNIARRLGDAGNHDRGSAGNVVFAFAILGDLIDRAVET